MALHLQGAVFDLDGVVTHTQHLHAEAWKALFDDYLNVRASESDEKWVPFSMEDYRRYVDGKPRLDGVRDFLAARNIRLPTGKPDDPPEIETLYALGKRKNEFFHKLIAQRGVDVDRAALGLIEEMRLRGIKVGMATSSKNGYFILEKAGIHELFDAAVDGAALELFRLQGKPAPDMFLKTAELLGVPPTACAVFEDAVAGVEAGRRGKFAVVVGVNREGRRAPLRKAGADLVVHDMGDIGVEQLNAWIADRRVLRPSALNSWDEIRNGLANRPVAVFLDYDGTLSPIVSRPELAVLPPARKETLRELADLTLTVIVSGRERENVARLVDLPNLYYAGSHGFDIAGPNGSIRYRAGEDYVADIAEACEILEEKIRPIEGAVLENKRFAAALHYRLADPDSVPKLEFWVDEIVQAHPRLRKTLGKKVFELRPNIEWDKGKALSYLLEALDVAPETIPIYIGDDVTDEDAFAAVAQRGIGILVADAPQETQARYRVQDVEEVGELLQLTANFLKERSKT